MKTTVAGGVPGSQPPQTVARGDLRAPGPAKTQQAAADRRRLSELLNDGNRQEAERFAREALTRSPDDEGLRAFVALDTKPEEQKLKESSLKDKFKALADSFQGGDAGEAPPGAAIVASPLHFTAAAAAPGLAPGRDMAGAALAARASELKMANPLVMKAGSRFRVGDLSGAEKLLDQRLEENPSDTPARRLRALVHRRQGRYEESARDAREALVITPWDTRVRRMLVDDLVDLGRSDEAMREVQDALRSIPNDAQLLAARAQVWGSLGDEEKRLEDLKLAARLDLEFAQLYNEALAASRPQAKAAASGGRPRPSVVWLGAAGTALLFFSFALYRRRGDSGVRVALRAEDHAAASRPAAQPTSPGGFRIVRTLGQGGMGVVYEALDLGLQRTVALKKLRGEVADHPRERARFLKEARTVAALKHPNIVEIHAIHEDAEGLFLVFEKVDGRTLHEALDGGPLAPAEAMSVLKQVAGALDFAHSRGVVHQDLKPANIMLAAGTAKVMDFGIARRVQETLSTLSQIEVAGTPAYMAPEQELGQPVGPAADVFSLGCCAYELLTGRMPFPAGGIGMKIQKIYRPVEGPGLNPRVDAAIRRALEPQPSDRWRSAGAFADELAKSFA